MSGKCRSRFTWLNSHTTRYQIQTIGGSEMYRGFGVMCEEIWISAPAQHDMRLWYWNIVRDLEKAISVWVGDPNLHEE